MTLLNHKIDYSKPRKIIEGITINHYTEAQKVEMLEMIKELVKVNMEGDSIQLEPSEKNSDIKLIRYMFTNLTDKTEEILDMKEEDFIELIKNGDFVIKQVLGEFESIARELMFEIKKETSSQLAEFANMVEQGEYVNRLNEIAEKLGVTSTELIKLGMMHKNVEELEKYIENNNESK